MKKISLKLKITLWYTLAMVVISALVLFTMNTLSRNIIKKDISQRLITTVERISHAPRGGRHIQGPDFPLYQNGVYMTMFDSDRNLIKGQIPFGIDSSMLDFKDEYLRESKYDGNLYYVYDKKIPFPDHASLWIKGMVSLTDENYLIASAMKTNSLLSVVMILIASVGGYFIISRALTPVNKIRKTARDIIDRRDLSQRINIGKGTDEISELANTFDTMLEKIEETVDREKQFTSDASHELRTPVAVILSECEYMESCAKTSDDLKESGNAIKRQAEKMSKLISELLTISRMDKNTLSVNFEKTDISELLSFICDEQKEIQGENITLISEIEPEIKVNADRFLLARLFINLISNAYQYSRENGEISVSLKEEDEKIIFQVKDNGIGISEDDLQKIWERFFQADPARSNDNGSMGLGLSMVKWIASAHNGEVFAESELGEGSTFTFIFPKN